MTMRVTMRNPRRSEDGLSVLLVGTTYTVSDEYGQALVQANHAVDTDNVIATEDAAARDALLPAEVRSTRALVSGAGIVNTRDAMNRVTSMAVGGITYTITYDAFGVATISGGGQVMTVTRDAVGLVLSVATV